MLGRTVTELGLLDDLSALRLRRAFLRIQSDPDAAGDFWEPLTFSGRKGQTTLFRVHRFNFRQPGIKRPYFGDISFDFSQIRPGYPNQPPPDLIRRAEKDVVPEGALTLFPEFLSKCPAAIALKDRQGLIVWANDSYASVAGQPAEALVRKHARTIFNLPDTHPVVQNDLNVATNGCWMFAVETLPGKAPRTSLRFPLNVTVGQVGLLGVISTEFGEQDVLDSPFGLANRSVGARRRCAQRGPLASDIALARRLSMSSRSRAVRLIVEVSRIRRGRPPRPSCRRAAGRRRSSPRDRLRPCLLPCNVRVR